MRPSDSAANEWTSLRPMPRVTFGIIVLNGEPFTRYCLRAIYPFAHEIIIVEGGHEDTRAVATADGHSLDSTLDTIRRFCAEEDPENKMTLVTIDGFWPKRDELDATGQLSRGRMPNGPPVTTSGRSTSTSSTSQATSGGSSRCWPLILKSRGVVPAALLLGQSLHPGPQLESAERAGFDQSPLPVGARISLRYTRASDGGRCLRERPPHHEVDRGLRPGATGHLSLPLLAPVPVAGGTEGPDI